MKFMGFAMSFEMNDSSVDPKQDNNQKNTALCDAAHAASG